MNKAVSGVPAGGRRRFLFLQGCTSPFFARLGDRLRALGHEVFRINFNVGDAVYWWGRPAWHFREEVEHLPAYVADKFRQHAFTDLVMLGDTRPVHRTLFPVADQYGARIHVLEEGYLRPNWLTLEERGINGYSRLPRDPDWYRAAARLIPANPRPEEVPNPIRLLALHEIAYHLPNLLNPVLYPGYRTHRPHISPVEFWGWGNRFARMPWYERRDDRAISDLLASGQPFYLFPLQLDSDAQIRHHSPVNRVPRIVRDVVRSFYRHAPEDAVLVIKNHPLDTGLIRYRRWIERLQRRLRRQGRIIYLESGHLPTLLDHARGTVLVNSSVGTSALVHGCPVKALGRAIYDMPGLTFQGSLDEFWHHPERPDENLHRDFRKVVIHATQINGGFYTRKGIELGTRHAVDRMLEPVSRLDQLLMLTHGAAAATALS